MLIGIPFIEMVIAAFISMVIFKESVAFSLIALLASLLFMLVWIGVCDRMNCAEVKEFEKAQKEETEKIQTL